MRKLKFFIPFLVSTISAPLIGLVGCSKPTTKTYVFQFQGANCTINDKYNYSVNIPEGKTNIEFEVFIDAGCSFGEQQLPEGVTWNPPELGEPAGKLVIEKMDHDYTNICINAEYDTDKTPLTFKKVGGPTEADPEISYLFSGAKADIDIETSTDLRTWTDWEEGSKKTIDDGQKLWVRNKKETLSTSQNDIFQFIMNEPNQPIEAGGTISSMINYGKLSNFCFCAMFSGCKSLVAAPNLPDNVPLAQYCYWGMFHDCVSLEKPPVVPTIQKLEQGCYGEMFFGCSSLKIQTTSGELMFHSPNDPTSYCNLMFKGTIGGIETPEANINYFYLPPE